MTRPWPAGPLPARLPAAGAFDRLPEPGKADGDADREVPIGVQVARQQARQHAVGRLQWAMFHRLRQVNINHATAAWRGRYSMPLGPHALAFLFHQPEPTTGGIVVTAATRSWLAGPEAQHPIPLLEKLTTVTQQHTTDTSTSTGAAGADGHGQPHTTGTRAARPGRAEPVAPVWDLRTGLADRCDSQMAPDAIYAGLGFSTLNTTAGTFEEHCRTASTELDIPGAFCWLANPSGGPTDLQAMTAERAAARNMGTIAIHSYEALSTVQLTSDYPYAPVECQVLFEQSPYAHVLHRMWHLDQALRQADITRRAAALDQPHTRRGRPS